MIIFFLIFLGFMIGGMTFADDYVLVRIPATVTAIIGYVSGMVLIGLEMHVGWTLIVASIVTVVLAHHGAEDNDWLIFISYFAGAALIVVGLIYVTAKEWQPILIFTGAAILFLATLGLVLRLTPSGSPRYNQTPIGHAPVAPHQPERALPTVQPARRASPADSWQSHRLGAPVLGTSDWFPGKTLFFYPVGERHDLSQVPTTRISHHGRDFVLALVKQPSGRCRAYLISQPGYGSVSSSAVDAHRLYDSDIDTHYICWAPEPTDPSEMANVLALWIAGTCLYIDGSDGFPSPYEIVRRLKNDSVSAFSVVTPEPEPVEQAPSPAAEPSPAGRHQPIYPSPLPLPGGDPPLVSRTWLTVQDLVFQPFDGQSDLSQIPVTHIRHNGRVFRLALVRQPGDHYRVYLLRQPAGYGAASGGLNNPRRRYDPDTRTNYIDFGHEPANPTEMANALTLWIAGTGLYLQRGSFPTAREVFDWLRDEAVAIERRQFMVGRPAAQWGAEAASQGPAPAPRPGTGTADEQDEAPADEGIPDDAPVEPLAAEVDHDVDDPGNPIAAVPGLDPAVPGLDPAVPGLDPGRLGSADPVAESLTGDPMEAPDPEPEPGSDQALWFCPIGERVDLSQVPVTCVRHKNKVFRLALVRLPDGRCRAYLLSQPDYGTRPAGRVETHRMYHGDLDTNYICWEPEPTDPSAMETIVAIWIAGTCLYIERGEFPTPPVIVAWLRDESVPAERRRLTVDDPLAPTLVTR